MMSCYLTIEAPVEGLYKEKGSRFLSFAFPVETPAGAMEHIKTIRKEHPKARHHCFAYRTGTDGKVFRAVDDGEPQGTAGKPILGQIDKAGLTQTLIVVARYFGGTLLGAAGLMRAYRESAADAILHAQIIEKVVHDYYRITCGYDALKPLKARLKKSKAEIVEEHFGEECKLTVAVEAKIIFPEVIPGLWKHEWLYTR